LDHEEWPNFEGFINSLIEGETKAAHFALPYSTDFIRGQLNNNLERQEWYKTKLSCLSRGFEVSRDMLTTIYVSRESLELIERLCEFGVSVLGMPLKLRDGSFRTAPVVAGLLIGSVIRFSGDIRQTIYDTGINREFGYCKAGFHDGELISIYPYSVDDAGKAVFNQHEGGDYFYCMTRSFEGFWKF
jgi:hypothetical protein